MAINVTSAPYNAKNDGSADASAAIQQAINVAKSLSANPFAPYLATVYFPAGYYLISNPINLTGANGIWLVGDGGSYLNTIILGNTGSQAMFDFSGSSQSGCENFTFIPSSGSNPSTLGVQFALTNTGGLNCGIKKCYFQMTDVPSANSGFGSIGVLNVRSEEFYIHECLVRANTPLIMSASANLSQTGTNYTASSFFQTLSSGTGTMGVTSVNATSLQTLEKRQPAMVLLGTNSFNFQGYIGRLSASIGTNETAILCVSYTTNLRVHATVESFSRVLKINDTGFGSSELDVVVGVTTAPTTDLIDVSGCLVVGLRARVSLSVPSQRTRYVLYHAPVNGGNAPATGLISNSEVSCYDISSNQYIISPNLLKKGTNLTLNTSKPFEKRGGRIRLLSSKIVSAGSNGSITSAIVLQFLESNQLPFSFINGGYYRVWIDGVMRAGGYGSGAAATLCFQAQIVINQRYDGNFDLPAATVITLDESTTNPSYLLITGVSVGIGFSGGIGTVTVTPQVSGSGVGEGVNFDGTVELQSDFQANEPIPL
jgi:hypothetical protein